MQLETVDSLWNVYMTWQEHIVKCTVQKSTHNNDQLFAQFCQMVEYTFTNYVVWVRVLLQSIKFKISRLSEARSSLKFRQLQGLDSL